MSGNRSRIPSPARSVGSARKLRPTARRVPRSLPADSPHSTRSSTSGPPSRPPSFLNDDTEIDGPNTRSWWKKLPKNSVEIGDVLGHDLPQENVDFVEIARPPSSMRDNENSLEDLNNMSDSTNKTLGSINLPQRKLFTHKQTQNRNEFKNIINRQESIRKQKNAEMDKTIAVPKKDLFPRNRTKEQKQHPYPVPGTSKIVNVTTNTTRNKVNSTIAIDTEYLKKGLFSKRKENLKLPAFTNILMSDSEDEVTLTQERLIVFKKNPPVLRSTSRRSSKRPSSPASSIYSETMEMENWKLLPSSTMMGDDIIINTPAKKHCRHEIDDNAKADVTVLAQEDPLEVEKDTTKIAIMVEEVHISNKSSIKHFSNEELNLIYDNAERDVTDSDQEVPQEIKKVSSESSTIVDEDHISNKSSIEHGNNEAINEIYDNAETDVTDSDQELPQKLQKDTSRMSKMAEEDLITNSPAKNNLSNEEINEVHYNAKTDVKDADKENHQNLQKYSSRTSTMAGEDIITNTPAKNHHSSEAIYEMNDNAETDGSHQEIEKDASEISMMVEEVPISSKPSIEHCRNVANNEMFDTVETDLKNSDLFTNTSAKKYLSHEELHKIDGNTEVDMIVLAQEDLQEVEKNTSFNEDEMKTNSNTMLSKSPLNIGPGRESNIELRYRYSAESPKNISDGVKSLTEDSGWNSHTMHATKVAEKTMNLRKSLRTLVLDKAAKTRPSKAFEGNKSRVDSSQPTSPNMVQDNNSDRVNSIDDNHSIGEDEGDDNNSVRDDRNDEEHSVGGDRSDDNHSFRDDSSDNEHSNRGDRSESKHSVRDNSSNGNNSDGGDRSESNQSVRDNSSDDNNSNRSDSESNHSGRVNSRHYNNSERDDTRDENHSIIDNTNNDNLLSRDDWIDHNHSGRSHSDDHKKSVNNYSSDDEDPPEFRKTGANTTQTTMDAYIKKIKEANKLRTQIIQEKVQNAGKKARSDPNWDARYFEYQTTSGSKTRNKMQGTQAKRDNSAQHKGKNVTSKIKNTLNTMFDGTEYKPPKLYKPPKAPWINKYLYQFLSDKLKVKYQLNTRVEVEKFVHLLFEMYKHCTRKSTDVRVPVMALKKRMAQLGLVTTHFDFYVRFVEKYMPKEFCIKVIPDLVNGLPLPKDGIFSDIIPPSSLNGSVR